MTSQQHAVLLLPAAGATLELGKRDTPTPGPGQVLVRNKAVALNPVDGIIARTGFILGEFGWPVVLGQDGAGDIVAVGEGVTGWKVGDRVLYQSNIEKERATFQELSIAEAARIARIPEKLSYEDAATLPLTFATAAIGAYKPKGDKLTRSGQDIGGAGLTAPWEAGGRGKYAGQPALITSGSSSVGQYAIQLAKLGGFNPIITTASKHNKAYCKKAGATHVIDYHEVSYAELPNAVAKIIGEVPLKYVYDAVSTPESQKAGWDVLSPGGALVIVKHPSDAVAGKQGKDDDEGKRVVAAFGAANAPYPGNREFGAGMYVALTDMLEKGEVKTNKVEHIGHGLEAIRGGLERLQKGVSGVKLVVTL